MDPLVRSNIRTWNGTRFWVPSLVFFCCTKVTPSLPYLTRHAWGVLAFPLSFNLVLEVVYSLLFFTKPSLVFFCCTKVATALHRLQGGSIGPVGLLLSSYEQRRFRWCGATVWEGGRHTPMDGGGERLACGGGLGAFASRADKNPGVGHSVEERAALTEAYTAQIQAAVMSLRMKKFPKSELKMDNADSIALVEAEKAQLDAQAALLV